MKTFLVDIDGVCADNVPEILRLYNEDYDDDLVPADLTSYDMATFVKCGTEVYDYFWVPYLYDKVLPIDGAQSGVEWIRRKGHRVIFVTSGIHMGKIEWLHYHGFLPGSQNMRQPADVVIAHDKNLIKGDFLIDDYPGNLMSFSGSPLLFDQPWNQESSLFRVHSWPDIVEFLSTL